MNREISLYVLSDLKKKMVFLIGPRQVGKTWLARSLFENFRSPVYLNYDSYTDRETIENRSWYRESDLIVFDEIHKMRMWKDYLKGVYDTRSQGVAILVTGSARLDTCRRSGDSLAGRFFVHRLMPLTAWELLQLGRPGMIDRLLDRGGFPEPFLTESDVDAARWRGQYADGLVRTDVLDFERVHDIRVMEYLLEMLRRRVGSPVSLAALAQDLSVSPTTVSRYVEILEALYIVFRVSPFARDVARAIKKSPKIYLFDTGLVEGNPGVRAENLTAVELLAHRNRVVDRTGKNLELRYLRTREGKEVDFVLVEGEQITHAVEVKWHDSKPAATLRYFTDRYGFPATQIVFDDITERSYGRIDVRPAELFFQELGK